MTDNCIYIVFIFITLNYFMPVAPGLNIIGSVGMEVYSTPFNCKP